MAQRRQHARFGCRNSGEGIAEQPGTDHLLQIQRQAESMIGESMQR
jgi:hypothetical protein